MIDNEISKKAHESSIRLLSGIMSYFAIGKDINELIFVPLAIVARIIRTHEAIELLLEKQHHSEAAVLVLTQFELRLDLLYVASDIKRATKWVEHDNPKATGKNVRAKLDQLFNPAEADRLYETFRYLSGIKHGNPLYSELGFPGRVRGRNIMITTGPIENVAARGFAKVLHNYSIYQLTWSAQVINKLIAPYAVVDMQLRHAVQNLFMEVRGAESMFRRYLRRKVSRRDSFFGMKAFKTPKDARRP